MNELRLWVMEKLLMYLLLIDHVNVILVRKLIELGIGHSGIGFLESFLHSRFYFAIRWV
jgi:hypothetical protein